MNDSASDENNKNKTSFLSTQFAGMPLRACVLLSFMSSLGIQLSNIWTAYEAGQSKKIIHYVIRWPVNSCLAIAFIFIWVYIREMYRKTKSR